MGTHALGHELQNSVTSAIEALDSEEFRRQGYMIIDFIADYYKNIEKYPVLSQVQPGYLKKCLSKSAPYDPEPMETILEDTQRHILPGITHWQSPNYFAYFPSSCSIAGFLGETLSNGFSIAGFNWISSPAATELETIVMDWLGEMLELPNSFLHRGTGGGVIHPTTCEAILSTLTAARDKILNKVGSNNISKLVVYGSDQTHSALKKAAQIVGIHEKNFRAIKTNRSSSFELPADELKSTIDSDIEAGLIPTFLCATIGTTATNAVDRLGPLSNTVKRYGMWIHVDAAYAGSACICPEFRHFIDGVEGVDSFSLNAHKWFFTTQECCCLWLKNPNDLIKSLSTDPEYLKNKASNSKQVIDYKDWQIGLTRKFRAMKLWLVLRNYGVRNLRNFIRSHINMAKIFEELVANDKRFEVVVPRNFSMVCFRALRSSLSDQQNGSLTEEHVNELNRKLLESINATGKLFVTHGVVEGIYVIRFSIGATLTQEQHVRKAWTVVKGRLEAILSEY